MGCAGIGVEEFQNLSQTGTTRAAANKYCSIFKTKAGSTPQTSSNFSTARITILFASGSRQFVLNSDVKKSACRMSRTQKSERPQVMGRSVSRIISGLGSEIFCFVHNSGPVGRTI
jgi:hypothetical protein